MKCTLNPFTEISDLVGYLLVFMLLVGGCNSSDSVDQAIVISNEVFSKRIHASSTEPAGISVEYYDAHDRMIATTTPDVPFFEFCLENQVVTSDDPIWVKTAFREREMLNNGTEYTMVFRGQEGVMQGLEVTILQQIFPGSSLMREKLTLNTTDNRVFRMRKHKGKLHFKFPQYSFLSSKSNEMSVTEFRLASWDLRPTTFNRIGSERSNSDKQNHMFYPNILDHELSEGQQVSVKGPISIVSNGKHSWLTSYEHASQDDLNGIVKTGEQEDDKTNDPLQGTIGVFDFPKDDKDFSFIDIRYFNNGDHIKVSVDPTRGSYLDGEEIDREHPYSTVWSATAFYEGNEIEEGKSIVQDYLFEQICEKKASRKPEFYYNTWGMQREENRNNGKDLRGVLTYDRIFEEIEYAAELGVDIFVLDDGWEQNQGDWTPHKDRLPEGLAPIKQKLEEHNIKMGVWFSPAGIDTTVQRYKEHQEWVILDSDKNPIQAQWGHPAFDMVSDFTELFINDCKKLIDDGALFFKWDAINTFYSNLPNLHHGSDQYSEEELRDRYAYMLPIYITRAMEVLTDYEPELIIEIDLTEARRVMMGLAPLSQGKLFFMNNGASSYNDYSQYRTMSMRTIPNEYAGIIPLELFTYANYPHNIENALQYNVNTSLIAGHGFWGNLSLMSKSERLEAGKKVAKAKRVLPYISQVHTEVNGKVGAPLEVYCQINEEESAGQIILFSTEAYNYEKKIKVNPSKFLAVLNQPYSLSLDTITVNFATSKDFSTNEAFILPNAEIEISIASSTCILDEVELEEGQLRYQTNGSGEQSIIWNKKHGVPQVAESDAIRYTVQSNKEFTSIKIVSSSPTLVEITAKSK